MVKDTESPGLTVESAKNTWNGPTSVYVGGADGADALPHAAAASTTMDTPKPASPRDQTFTPPTCRTAGPAATKIAVLARADRIHDYGGRAPHVDRHLARSGNAPAPRRNHRVR